MSDRLQTWHYGLVAQYWAEFNLEGPEIAYYRKPIGRHAQINPADDPYSTWLRYFRNQHPTTAE
jgi:hypothetical protein